MLINLTAEKNRQINSENVCITCGITSDKTAAFVTGTFQSVLFRLFDEVISSFQAKIARYQQSDVCNYNALIINYI